MSPFIHGFDRKDHAFEILHILIIAVFDDSDSILFAEREDLFPVLFDDFYF